jgi:hypothetical protein
MDSIRPFTKAIVAALLAGLAALGVALIPDAVPNVGSEVSAVEWVSIAIAFLTTLSGVWASPNTDPSGTHYGESVQPQTERVEQPIDLTRDTSPDPPRDRL